MDIGLAQIAVHHHHALPVGRKRERQIRRHEGLALARDGAGDQDALAVFTLVLETQRGVQRQERLGYLAVGIVGHDLGLVGLLHLFDLRNDPDQGHAHHRLDVKRALHPVVDVSHKEGKRHAQAEATEDPQPQIHHHVGRHIIILGGWGGRVEDRHHVGIDPGLVVDRVQARDHLLQGVLVDVQLPLQLAVIHQQPVQFLGTGFGLLQVRVGIVVIALRVVVGGVDRGRRLLNRLPQFILRRGQILVVLDHGWVQWFVPLLQPGNRNLFTGDVLGQTGNLTLARDKEEFLQILAGLAIFRQLLLTGQSLVESGLRGDHKFVADFQLLGDDVPPAVH